MSHSRTPIGVSFATSMQDFRAMSQTYTAVVKQEGDWWIGWIEEVPGVNCQEKTRERLLESLRVTLSEAIELNRAEARNAAGKGYEEFPIAI